MSIYNPVYIIAMLLLLVVLSEWLAQKKYFRHLGSALLVILSGAVLANLSIIPSSQNAPPVYDAIFTYVAPLSIFYLLLDVRLKDIKLAGLPMLSMFLVGAFATIAGVLISYYLIAPQNHHIQNAFAVAGMYTGTYIGGSANLNAIAIEYGVTKNGTLFAAINAADNIITAIWLIVCLTLPPLLQRMFPRKKVNPTDSPVANTHVLPVSTTENITITGFSLLLAIGVATLFISNTLSTYLPKIPSILILTTVALLLAQIKQVQQLKGAKILGFLFVLLFLAVVGAYCDLAALVQNKEVAVTLLCWVSLAVFIHGFILFIVGGVFRQDWYLLSIASNANIGGATSATAMASSLNRADLRLPGILAGSIGNALGTYLGFLVAEFLR